jgi:hypothetical protein
VKTPAAFLYREIKSIKINCLGRDVEPCSQSYQQKMGISGQMFVLPALNLGLPAIPFEINDL